jgi:hypothetical protein
MRFTIPATNQGAAIYPGAILDDVGVNDDVWVASGVICALQVNFPTALIPKIEIYDFCQDDTGRPAFDTSHYLTDAGTDVVGLLEGLGTDGDALGSPIFECYAGAAGGDDKNAFVTANCRKVWEFGPVTAIEMNIDHINAVCPHGMVIHSVGTVTGIAYINVTYIPWSLGAYRKKMSLKTSALGFERPSVM